MRTYATPLGAAQEDDAHICDSLGGGAKDNAYICRPLGGDALLCTYTLLGRRHRKMKRTYALRAARLGELRSGPHSLVGASSIELIGFRTYAALGVATHIYVHMQFLWKRRIRSCARRQLL